MTFSKISPALAVLALMVALPLAAPDASARTSAALKECNTKWKTAQDNGTLPSGMQWPDFAKTMCGLDVGGTAASAPASTPSTTTTTTSTTTSGTGGTFMEQCSASWKQMKASNTVPSGMSWRDFVKQKCVVPAGTPAPQTTTQQDNSGSDTAAPTETSTASQQPVKDWHTIPVAQTDKNGKPFSKGQIEAHQRIKECAAEWHQAKANHTLAAGEKWPHFWSTCNTRLKTQN